MGDDVYSIFFSKSDPFILTEIHMHTIYGGWGLAPNYKCSFDFKFPSQFPVIIQYGESCTGRVKLHRDFSYIFFKYTNLKQSHTY